MMVANHVRRAGIAAAIGVLGLAAVPLASQAAPEALHYTIQASTCTTCFVAANVDLFPGGADDSVVEVALPFPVYVYGVKHTTAWVSSNGNIQFAGPGETTFTNASLPSSALSPKGAVAPYWDDLIVEGSGSGTGVFSKSTSTEYVVSWRGTEVGTGNPVRAEVIFFKTSRTIEFNYIQGTAESATIGIQKAAGGPATQYSYDVSGATFDGLTLKFVPAS